MHSRLLRSQPSLRRRGFSLVELMIAAGILLILSTMAVAVYSTTASADRIRSSARQVQSAFGGARDRAIKAFKTDGSTRGLRLLVDSTDPTTVTSMVYIGSGAPWSDGRIMIGRQDLNGDGQADNSTVRTIRAWPRLETDGSISTPGWRNLYDQGLLVDGARIRIPAETGTWYTVSTYLLSSYAGSGPEILVLTSDYRVGAAIPYATAPYFPYAKGTDGFFGTGAGTFADDDQNGTADNYQEAGAPGSDDVTDINAFSGEFTYELELKPSVLPGQEPLRLSSGIAIDLFNSRLPANWYQQRSLAKGSAVPPTNQGWDAGSGNYYFNGWGVWTVEGTDPSNSANDIYRQYSPRMDIMFAPSGTVTGPLTTIGMLHLRLADIQDIAESRDPANPQAAPMYYSTLFTQTGYLATFPVNLTDVVAPLGVADDPLYFARTGGTAGR